MLYHVQVMQQFSSSRSIASSTSFSVSGPLPLIPFSQRDHILQHSCPELKLLLPGLHEPACFGKNLTARDVHTCKMSICCFNNTKKKSC